MKLDAKRKAAAVPCTATDDRYTLIILPTRSTFPSTDDLINNITSLLDDTTEYTPIPITDMLPPDRKARYKFLCKIKQEGVGRQQVCLYSVSFGSHMETCHFLWNVDPEHPTDHEQKMNTVTRSIDADLPVYHSSSLKRSFKIAADSLNIAPMKARALYKIATNDATASKTNLAAIDIRVMQYCSLEDEDIMLDLRALNHRPRSFDNFFDSAAAFIEGQIETAVDDRRHDRVTHLAQAMSAADLYR